MVGEFCCITYFLVDILSYLIFRLCSFNFNFYYYFTSNLIFDGLLKFEPENWDVDSETIIDIESIPNFTFINILIKLFLLNFFTCNNFKFLVKVF